MKTKKQKEIKKKIARFSYEPEADVLAWEISGMPINYAKEIGNIVVHFTKNNIPVLVEILEASKFLAKVKNAKTREKISIPRYAVMA